MAEAILKNTRQIISICVYCDGQYGICSESIGVPVILGINGIEKVIELKLNAQEKVDTMI